MALDAAPLEALVETERVAAVFRSHPDYAAPPLLVERMRAFIAKGGLGSLDDSTMEAETRKIMGRLNPNFTRFKMAVRSLSGGQRQAVAIARAVYFNARILIMDEPTAALGPAETAQVRNLIRQLKQEGIGIFLISHDIHDVFDLSDRISVMYHGRIVDTVAKDSVTPDEVVSMIILGKRPDELTAIEREQLELNA